MNKMCIYRIDSPNLLLFVYPWVINGIPAGHSGLMHSDRGLKCERNEDLWFVQGTLHGNLREI